MTMNRIIEVLIVTLAIIIIVVLSLVAFDIATGSKRLCNLPFMDCGQQVDNNGSPPPSPIATIKPQKPNFNSIDNAIMALRTTPLRVAYSRESAPYTFGEIASGVEVDWFNDQIRYIEATHNLEITIQWIPIYAYERESIAIHNEADIVLGAFSNTPSRCGADGSVLCTAEIHMTDGAGMLIARDLTTRNSITDEDTFCELLTDLSIGVIAGTTQEQSNTTTLQPPGLAQACKNKGVQLGTIRAYSESRSSVSSAVSNGDVDVYITDTRIIRELQKDFPITTRFVALTWTHDRERYGYAFTKGNNGLRDLFDDATRVLRENDGLQRRLDQLDQ